MIKNVVEYTQPPFWSPWYCGGNVMWQNPQTALLSPVYPLTAIAGLPLAMKVNIVLHYFAGFVGMHLLLTRVLAVSFVPLVVYLASLFTLAGGHVMHVAVGHTVFLPAFYLPLILYFLIRAVQTQTVGPALWAGASPLPSRVLNPLRPPLPPPGPGEAPQPHRPGPPQRGCCCNATSTPHRWIRSGRASMA